MKRYFLFLLLQTIYTKPLKLKKKILEERSYRGRTIIDQLLLQIRCTKWNKCFVAISTLKSSMFHLIDDANFFLRFLTAGKGGKILANYK